MSAVVTELKPYRVRCDHDDNGIRFVTLTEADDYQRWCDSKPAFSCSPHVVECLSDGAWREVERVT